jgi:hypothetical protein
LSLNTLQNTILKSVRDVGRKFDVLNAIFSLLAYQCITHKIEELKLMKCADYGTDCSELQLGLMKRRDLDKEH